MGSKGRGGRCVHGKEWAGVGVAGDGVWCGRGEGCLKFGPSGLLKLGYTGRVSYIILFSHYQLRPKYPPIVS